MCLGHVHTQCTFLACIGKHWGCGGIRDLLVDPGVYASATVDKVLKGKQLNKEFHGLTLAYEALMQTWMVAFIQ